MTHVLSFILLLLLTNYCMGASIGFSEGVMESVIKLEQGKVSGPFGIFANCIEKQSHIKFEWSEYPTRRLFSMVDQNMLDIVYPVGITEQRNKVAIASKPVFSSERLWVYIGKPPDFNDRKLSIVVTRGTPTEETIKKLGYSNLSIVKYDALLPMLSTKRVAAALMPKKIFTGLVETYGLAGAYQGYQTQIFNKREIVFYLSKRFANDNLPSINQAIDACQHVKVQ